MIGAMRLRGGRAVRLTYVDGTLTGPAGATAQVRFLVDNPATRRYSAP